MTLFTKLPSWASILITVIAAVIVVGLVSWGTYTLVKPSPSKLPEGEEQPAQQQPTQQSKDETANWKTYTNKELGISFKYPSTWKAPKYIKPKEQERFGSSGVQGEIHLHPYGSITILDKNKFNNDYQQCLKIVGDEATCRKAFGRSYNELLKQMSFIKSLRSKNLTDNKYSHCYGKTPCSGIEGFNECDAIGGYFTLRTIHNDDLNTNTVRTIGFCGYEVGIQNYYYYVSLSVDKKLIEIQFKLFPYNSAVYEWGNKEQGYDKAKNWEKFNDEFRKSLWEDNPNELIKQEIRQYDLLVESIAFN